MTKDKQAHFTCPDHGTKMLDPDNEPGQNRLKCRTCGFRCSLWGEIYPTDEQMRGILTSIETTNDLPESWKAHPEFHEELSKMLFRDNLAHRNRYWVLWFGGRSYLDSR